MSSDHLHKIQFIVVTVLRTRIALSCLTVHHCPFSFRIFGM